MLAQSPSDIVGSLIRTMWYMLRYPWALQEWNSLWAPAQIQVRESSFIWNRNLSDGGPSTSSRFDIHSWWDSSSFRCIFTSFHPRCTLDCIIKLEDMNVGITWSPISNFLAGDFIFEKIIVFIDIEMWNCRFYVDFKFVCVCNPKCNPFH